MCVYVCMYMVHIRVRLCAYRVHLHAHIQTHVHAHTFVCVLHIYTHTLTYIHTYIHMQSLQASQELVKAEKDRNDELQRTLRAKEEELELMKSKYVLYMYIHII